MKTIKLIYKVFLLTVCCSLILSSCVKEDLLDLNDPGGVDGDKAWTTDYLTKMGMNGVYATLRYGIQSGGASNRELYQFDRFVTSQYRGNDNILSGSATPSEGFILNIWKDMYEGIGRANDAIIRIPERSESSEENKAIYIAEAKFLRAYFYFRLNQVFKGVPLYTGLISEKELDKPRETEARIWEFILEDLNAAINEPLLPNRYPAGNDNYGKVTKGAAYALRGKVYMYLKKYEEAISDFDNVKACGYDLFKGNYRQLFKEANEQSEEMIFSIQNIGTPNYGGKTQFYLGCRTTINGGGWGTYQVSPYAVDLYDNLDGSRFNWDDIIPGYNSMEPKHREVFFLRDTVGLVQKIMANGLSKDDAQKEAAGIRSSVEGKLSTFPANIKSLYLAKGNEDRIVKAYENRDPRLAANVITPYSSYLGSIANEDVIVHSRWPYRSDGAGVRDMRTDMIPQFFYMHRKFVYEGTTEAPNREYGPIDFPIIRYGDVLLMKAEALCELGRMGDAVDAVNQIRSRAGVALLNSSPATTVSGQDELRDRIRDERRVELLNEGVSYFDELRWGTFKETVFEKNGGAKQVWGEILYPYTWSGNKLYAWPIPLSEIQKNSNLTQNPDWGN